MKRDLVAALRARAGVESGPAGDWELARLLVDAATELDAPTLARPVARVRVLVADYALVFGALFAGLAFLCAEVSR